MSDLTAGDLPLLGGSGEVDDSELQDELSLPEKKMEEVLELLLADRTDVGLMPPGCKNSQQALDQASWNWGASSWLWKKSDTYSSLSSSSPSSQSSSAQFGLGSLLMEPELSLPDSPALK